MILCLPDLNAFRGFLGDANAAFQTQETIVYGDPRQGCLNDFILFLCDRLRDAGAIDTASPQSHSTVEGTT